MTARRVDVPADIMGIRVDRFLALRFRDRSRTLLQRGLQAGQVCDGTGRPLKPSSQVRGGDVLWVDIPGIGAAEGPPPFPTVLYEDDRLAVVDKPSGMLVHPAGTAFAWALIGLARARWPGREVHAVHRLDRDTSGAVALALDATSARRLKTALHAGELEKTYEAVVRGAPSWNAASLTGAIGREERSVRIRMAVRADGDPARTDVSVVDRRVDRTRVACRLWTGRTHQIRVHLATAGHPVLGDRLYAVEEDDARAFLEDGRDVRGAAGAPRLALHAARLVLPHPDGGLVDVTAPFPPALQDILDDAPWPVPAPTQ